MRAGVAFIGEFHRFLATSRVREDELAAGGEGRKIGTDGTAASGYPGSLGSAKYFWCKKGAGEGDGEGDGKRGKGERESLSNPI